MAKTIKPKKEKEKSIIEKVSTVVTGKGAYHLYIKLNDKEHETDTDNLVESIQSYKPAILRTAVSIKVSRGGRTIDRYLYLKDGKRLFQNKLTLEMFIRNLTLAF